MSFAEVSDSLWLPVAKIVEGEPITEFPFSEYIVQGSASVGYRLTFTYHLSSDLRPYIYHRLHGNGGRKIA